MKKKKPIKSSQRPNRTESRPNQPVAAKIDAEKAISLAMKPPTKKAAKADTILSPSPIADRTETTKAASAASKPAGKALPPRKTQASAKSSATAIAQPVASTTETREAERPHAKAEILGGARKPSYASSMAATSTARPPKTKSTKPAAPAGVTSSKSSGSASTKTGAPQAFGPTAIHGESAAEPTKVVHADRVADADESTDGLTMASQPFQDFATETQRLARESFEETTNLLGKMRGAKNPVDIVLLQTTYLQHSFRMYTELAQRVGQLMAASQSTLMKQGQATIESIGSIVKKP